MSPDFNLDRESQKFKAQSTIRLSAEILPYWPIIKVQSPTRTWRRPAEDEHGPVTAIFFVNLFWRIHFLLTISYPCSSPVDFRHALVEDCKPSSMVMVLQFRITPSTPRIYCLNQWLILLRGYFVSEHKGREELTRKNRGIFGWLTLNNYSITSYQTLYRTIEFPKQGARLISGILRYGD